VCQGQTYQLWGAGPKREVRGVARGQQTIGNVFPYSARPVVDIRLKPNANKAVWKANWANY